MSSEPGRKSSRKTAKHSISNESIKKNRKSTSTKNVKEIVDDIPDNVNFKEKLVYFFFNNMIENFIKDYQREDSVKCMCSLPKEKIVDDLLAPLKKKQSITRVASSVSVPDRRTRRSSSSKIVLKRPPDWLLPTFRERATIVFTNGNIYSGDTSNKMMDGWGTFRWCDGTIYTGQFEEGCLTGNGTMRLADLSVYKGDFCNGYFHGDGTLNIANSTMIYKGEWKFGKKHGKGWMYYGMENWYDGEWFEDEKHGFGERHYKDGSKYKGGFLHNLRNGQGTMVFANNDFYRGEWRNDLMHGYGEYYWNCYSSKELVFTPTNSYKGNWVNGKRNGVGLMNFGNEIGSQFYGMWENNVKHGAGVMICGNGNILYCNPLFVFDKVVQKKAVQTCPNDCVEFDVFLYRKISEQLKENLEMFHDDILNCIMRNSELIAKNQFVVCAARNTDCSPLNITLNTNSNQLNLRFLIDFVLGKFPHDFRTKQDEENQMQDLISLHLTKLMTIYEKYAKLAACNFVGKPLMVRLFLWQLYKDLKLPENGISLIETDLNVYENPACCLIRKHDPFEEIYFWQFLLSIITNAVCLFLMDDKNAEKLCCKTGILYQIFIDFLNEKLYKLSLNIKWETSEIPMQCFYSLYMKIGEAHSVRTFFGHCCTKRGLEPYCFNKSINGNNKTVTYCSVVVGNSLSFTAVDLLHPCTEESPENNDPYCKNLFVFRKLGKKKLFQCITNVCPYIMTDNHITNMDYKLSFIEFYQIILQCTNELCKLQN